MRAEKGWDNFNGLDEYIITDTGYLKTADCTIEVIHASFFDGRLLKVQIQGLSNNYNCILETFVHQFGPPTESDTAKKSNNWTSDKVEAMLWPISSGQRFSTRSIDKKLDEEYGEYCTKNKMGKYSIRID